jgi:hypothetical protein
MNRIHLQKTLWKEVLVGSGVDLDLASVECEYGALEIHEMAAKPKLF